MGSAQVGDLNKVLQKIAAELTDKGQLAWMSSSLKSEGPLFFFFNLCIFFLSRCL